MLRRIRAIIFSAAAIATFPTAVQAGMPSVLPQDLEMVWQLRQSPHERLQAISFFLLGIILSAWAVRVLWNHLARDFSRLPRLTYAKALSLVVMWGLLFVVVLTMISGARELMTPGAWKQQGFTYTLADESPEATTQLGNNTDLAQSDDERTLREPDTPP